jgi:hypothetical protein
MSLEISLMISIPSKMPGLPEEGEFRREWPRDPDYSTENQAQREYDQTFNFEARK